MAKRKGAAPTCDYCYSEIHIEPTRGQAGSGGTYCGVACSGPAYAEAVAQRWSDQLDAEEE